MSQPPNDLPSRRVMGLGRLTAWQAAQLRNTLGSAEEPPSVVPAGAPPQRTSRRPLASWLGLLGSGLMLWGAWLLTASAAPGPVVPAWGGMVGGLVLIGLSFRLQRRLP